MQIPQQEWRFEMGENLSQALFAHEHKRLQKLRGSFVDEHNKLTGHRDETLVYQGEFFNKQPGWHVQRSTPDPSLFPAMDRYRKDKAKIEDDQTQVRQFLTRLLQSCENLPDVRDALPELLVNLNSQFQSWSRTRPEAWPILDDPAAFRQYQKILPKIEFYAASKLLY